LNRLTDTPETRENKVEKSGILFAPKKMPSAVHVSHALHHLSATQNRVFTTRFSQNTPQKARKTAKPRSPGASHFSGKFHR
jgi:hypothetical protein